LVDSTPEELKEKYQCSLDAVFRRITRNGKQVKGK
jgi:Mor family transcriptional regulator